MFFEFFDYFCKMNVIFLIGYMCSGKTTLGRALSEAAAVDYVDLDELIEREQGMSVGEIFASRGEETFRALETDALARVARRDNVIVGCGGGTACREENMALMESSGITVLLEASRDRMIQRLLEGRHKRPRIASLTDGEIVELMEHDLERRRVYYERARERFDSSLLETPAEVAGSVKRFMDKFNLKRL